MKHKACVQGDLSQLHDYDVKILSMGITIYVVKAICHTCQSIISRNESEYFPRGMSRAVCHRAIYEDQGVERM